MMPNSQVSQMGEDGVRSTRTRSKPLRVAYLMGAGATQASVSFQRSRQNVLMKGLAEKLVEGARVATSGKRALSAIDGLLTDVEFEHLDFEHLITFLANTPSAVHRKLADKLRSIFVRVLSEGLNNVEIDLDGPATFLYEVLFDLHRLPEYHESLAGILTLNYDSYIENAYERVYGEHPSLGVALGAASDRPEAEILKLHGSLDWVDSWPLQRGLRRAPLWIPPGIHKEKSAYPFNLIWGRAREVVRCDVLRIVGCRLSPNDWDLVSLLFSMQKTRPPDPEYRIEVIGFPADVASVRKTFPYLTIRSLPELPDIGPRFVSEQLAIEETAFEELRPEQKDLIQSESKYDNPFAQWLKHKAELAKIAHSSSIVDDMALSRFLDGRTK